MRSCFNVCRWKSKKKWFNCLSIIWSHNANWIQFSSSCKKHLLMQKKKHNDITNIEMLSAYTCSMMCSFTLGFKVKNILSIIHIHIIYKHVIIGHWYINPSVQFPCRKKSSTFCDTRTPEHTQALTHLKVNPHLIEGNIYSKSGGIMMRP